MSEALVLVSFALGMGTGGAAALRRARWTRSLPRLGVAAWQALSLSVLVALLLAGVTVVVPSVFVSANLAEWLDACVLALRAQYATPGGALLNAIGATATLGLIGRVGYLLITGMRAARRARQEHLDQLNLAARRDTRLGVLIVEHPAAAAYCLPGRARTVVLTSAAISALDDRELAAVLAHERAHMRGRHDLVAVSAEALARTLPFLPVFRWAREESARLVEMIADDDAAAGADRLTVACALVRLAEGSVPAVALGAADVAALARVHRLLEPAQRIGLARRTVITGILALTVVIPVAIAAGPAVAATRTAYCPVSAAPHGV